MANNIQYPPSLAELLQKEVSYALVPTRAESDLRETLQTLSLAEIFGDCKVTNRDMARCCLSGLWLRFDFLDESHTISQSIHTSSGSYWHGIMHRREPDWSNAKYWFRQTGDHAIFSDLLAAAKGLADSGLPSEAKTLTDAAEWDPFAFVDLCEAAHRQGGELESFCRAAQLAEWELLFDDCYTQAIG